MIWGCKDGGDGTENGDKTEEVRNQIKTAQSVSCREKPLRHPYIHNYAGYDMYVGK